MRFEVDTNQVSQTVTKMTELIRNIPVDLHMLHGDFHVKNIMLQGVESLLIDMDTLCHGHPVFELGSIYNAYVGFYETAPEDCGEFLGISAEEARNLWDLTLRDYLCGQKDPEDVEKKAALLGHVRLLRRAFRRNEEDSPKGRKAIENSRKQISRLLKEVDTLVF